VKEKSQVSKARPGPPITVADHVLFLLRKPHTLPSNGYANRKPPGLNGPPGFIG
jgi:hypothetical protein